MRISGSAQETLDPTRAEWGAGMYGLAAMQRQRLLTRAQQLAASVTRLRQAGRRISVSDARALAAVGTNLRAGPEEALARALVALDESVELCTCGCLRVDDLRTVRGAILDALLGLEAIARPCRLPDLSRLGAAEIIGLIVSGHEGTEDDPEALALDGLPSRLDLSTKIALFGVLREAAVATRAGAPGAEIGVRAFLEGDELVLVVQVDASTPLEERLALWRERVELMGGQLRVDAQPGRGASLSIRLPVAEQPATPAHLADTEDSQHSARPATWASSWQSTLGQKLNAGWPRVLSTLARAHVRARALGRRPGPKWPTWTDLFRVPDVRRWSSRALLMGSTNLTPGVCGRLGVAVIHPAFDALAALVDHQPTSVTQSTLLDHVADCGRCAEDVDWVRQVIDVMRTDDSLAAPPHVVRRAVRIISRGGLLHTSPSLRSIGRCLIARLRFDSAAILAPQGLRSGTGESRRRIYEALPFELDILASPHRSGWALSGQVLGAPENQSGTVTVSGTNTRAESTLNEMLEFQVAALLPSGTYRIEVQFGSTQLQIPWLELGP